MAIESIARRIVRLNSYQAPLTERGRDSIGRIRDAGTKGASIPAQPADKLVNLSQTWFQRYLLNLDTVKLNSLLSRFPDLAEISVNVTWGCSGGCVFCHIPEPARVESMPWPWVNELAKTRLNGFRPTVNAGTLLGDPLRDYYDPLFDKDFGDVDRLFDPFAIMTVGFEIGSIGERAARKIVARRQAIARFSITIASEFYRRLGYEEYIRHMRNAFRIFPTAYFVANGIKEKGDPISVEEMARRITGSTKDIPLYYVTPRGKLKSPRQQARFEFVSAEASRAQGPKKLLMFQPSGQIAYRQARGGECVNIPITRYDPALGQTVC